MEETKMNEKKIVLEELRDIVGPERASDDPEVCIAYTKDAWFAVAGAAPLGFVVVQPESEEEVIDIVKLANKYKQKICVRGSGTNLTGQAIPYRDDILVDMKKMNRIIEINEELMTATVEAGVTHGQIAKAALEKNLRYIGPGGPYSGTVVGNISFTSMKGSATKFGQQQVIGLHVVLPTGELLRTSTAAYPELRDVTPYYPDVPAVNLTPLFLFTRGVLGIITRATIRLYTKREVSKNFTLGFNSMEELCNAIQKIQKCDVGTSMSGGYAPGGLMTGMLGVTMEDRKLPDYNITVEIDGTAKQVEADEEILRKVAAEESGECLELPESLFIEEIPGAIRFSPRMLFPEAGPIRRPRAPATSTPEARDAAEAAPRGGGAMIILAVYAQVLKVPKIWDELAQAAIDCGLGPPPWCVMMPQDRGLNTYLEVDFPYDPLDPEMGKKRNAFIPLYREIRNKYGACTLTPSAFRRTEVYYQTAKKIKDLLDPNGIMNMGKIF